ncbi:MAG: COX15/CtaA family protein [Anaerolineales bacterium]|nr:COX15/CtaA family protein [Anaerolineales bacterium]
MMKWLYVFAFVVAFLVVFGGFVRLTRSGLSIVEWNPISGAMPPSGQQAWEEEFAKYQETPEYKLINTGMTLPEYKFIFYMEWIHRNIARLAGLFYAFPVFYFLFKKTIPFQGVWHLFCDGHPLHLSSRRRLDHGRQRIGPTPRRKPLELDPSFASRAHIIQPRPVDRVRTQVRIPRYKQKSNLVASFQTCRVLFCHPYHSSFVRRVYGWPQSGARFRYLAVDAWQINSTQPVQLVDQHL